jgi:hypothetical protein
MAPVVEKDQSVGQSGEGLQDEHQCLRQRFDSKQVDETLRALASLSSDY